MTEQVEVEKKFRLPQQDNPLYDDADLVKQCVNRDRYYDDATYTLLRHNAWLRSRNGLWEVKHVQRNGTSKKSREYEGVRATYHFLDKAGFRRDSMRCIGSVYTFRSTYRLDTGIDERSVDVSIDEDQVNFRGEPMSFSVLEVEVMDERQEQAERRIEEVANRYGLEPDPAGRKIVRWMREHKPGLYELFSTYK